MLFDSPRKAGIHSHHYYVEGFVYGFIERDSQLRIIIEHFNGEIELLPCPLYWVVFKEPLRY